MQQMSYIREWGGRFVVPIPGGPRLMSSTGACNIEPLRDRRSTAISTTRARISRTSSPPWPGARVLMTGGAGFLGYYMVQSVLHWNDRAPADAHIALTVFDNYVRGVPAWLEALGGRKDLTLMRFDIRHPLPDPCPSSTRSSTPPASRRRRTTAQHPLETMDANIDGLRRLLEYARAPATRAATVSGFLFYSTQRDLRRSRARHDPDARGLSRQRVVHGTARVLRRVEALRRNPVRGVREAATGCR